MADLGGTHGAGAGVGLRFRVLGPALAERHGAPLALGAPQQQALLVVLLLNEGRPVSTAELLDALWGERPPARAVGILRTYVSRLRALLEPERAARTPATVLMSAGDGYALRLDTGAVDAGLFEARLSEAARLRGAGETAAAHRELGSALRLWFGVPLAGLPGPYVQRQRERLTGLWLSAQEDHFHGALELGLHRQTVAALGSFAAEHPLRERTQALLMLALHRVGRQAEAFAVYGATCRTLDGELGVGPGPELRALYERLLGSAPGGAVSAEPTPSAYPVPAQLPPDVTDFGGRTEAVTRLGALLREAAAGKTMAVAALTGLGGVGKTALAVHVAHTHRDSFPDGQLYVALRGDTSAPADISAALGHLLHSLGAAAQDIPEGAEERAALYRSMLAGRRVLILLDNAHDLMQVKPLLPGVRGCAVLITSRSRTVAPAGARIFAVDTMNEPEALRLLGAVAGHERVAAEPEAARELVASCGWLPLAIRIAGARLAARRRWTLADLAVRLRDDVRRLDELRVGKYGMEDSIRRGYEALDPCPARVFRRVAAAGVAVFGRSSVATLLGVGEQQARDAMECLVDAGLLEEHGADSYRCHDLVRLFARRQLERSPDPAERAAARVLRGAAPARTSAARAPRSAPAPVRSASGCTQTGP
ncbi:AfsR/SARP family transcriptional regulator [Streptomyces sp. NBC_01465]|uniref:AfsR/SARP family transcriptional regulator n=1 Tax=Streptomyces sp. NBC_01465 TaxID=2903878 RepID=UPI002E345B67|nr:BTAD domain-containing putative transcriptional regulator [Streptomyces sp. NBC_01465]